ncbi:hypothetical protein K488DRAFT_52538 [Vararia minispora EC-137]|uniref:Uncharacterized protein n=1 Tax=Vararia minispora EC-137 TaxID=1314806 RepID=A0ACB8QHB8_9AGAM|nr:hypothetical protein K488DRAFT_52538 [Vararia minispora EC-137]
MAHRASSGHYLLDEFRLVADHLREVRSLRYQLSLRQVGGHAGSIGNEKADVIVKAAAQGVSSHVAFSSHVLRSLLPYSVSARCQHHLDALYTQRTMQWRTSQGYTHLKHIISTGPHKGFLKFVSNLPGGIGHSSLPASV